MGRLTKIADIFALNATLFSTVFQSKTPPIIMLMIIPRKKMEPVAPFSPHPKGS